MLDGGYGFMFIDQVVSDPATENGNADVLPRTRVVGLEVGTTNSQAMKNVAPAEAATAA
jgi:hypothetical protein